jgi:hypothetical protein
MIKILKQSRKYFATVVWNMSESSGIQLGRFAPKIFGWMIGAEGKLVRKVKTK